MTTDRREEVRALRYLDDRLHHVSYDLERQAHRAAAAHAMSEYSRVDGKRQGVELARSYLKEAIKEAQAKRPCPYGEPGNISWEDAWPGWHCGLEAGHEGKCERVYDA